MTEIQMWRPFTMVLDEKGSDQECFDFVVEALRAQGGPAVSADGAACVYGEPGGRRCAVGHLMPEAFGEQMSIDAAVNLRFVAAPRNLQLLLRLQQAHDDSARAYWAQKAPTAFVWVAAEFGLNPQSAIDWHHQSLLQAGATNA